MTRRTPSQTASPLARQSVALWLSEDIHVRPRVPQSAMLSGWRPGPNAVFPELDDLTVAVCGALAEGR